MEMLYKTTKLLFDTTKPNSEVSGEAFLVTGFEVKDIRVDVYHLKDQFSASRQVARIKIGKDVFLSYQSKKSPHIEKQILIMELLRISEEYPSLRGSTPPLSSSRKVQEQFLDVEVVPLYALCGRLKSELEQRELYEEFSWKCEEAALLNI